MIAGVAKTQRRALGPPCSRSTSPKGDRRPPGTLWRANPREQGLLRLTDAIAWFGAKGHSVSLPLIDSQPYDLIVDDQEGLQRVQVKTTTQRQPNGTFIVQLCTRGGNQSFHTTKYFAPTLVDLLFVLTDAGDRYVIPSQAITSRTSLTIGKRCARSWWSPREAAACGP